MKKKTWDISCLLNNFAQYLLNLCQHELLLGLDCKSPSSLLNRAVLNCTAVTTQLTNSDSFLLVGTTCVSSVTSPNVLVLWKCPILVRKVAICYLSCVLVVGDQIIQRGCIIALISTTMIAEAKSIPCKYKVWFLTILSAELQNYIFLRIVLAPCQETSILEMQTGLMQSWRKIIQYYL